MHLSYLANPTTLAVIVSEYNLINPRIMDGVDNVVLGITVPLALVLAVCIVAVCSYKWCDRRLVSEALQKCGSNVLVYLRQSHIAYTKFVVLSDLVLPLQSYKNVA